MLKRKWFVVLVALAVMLVSGGAAYIQAQAAPAADDGGITRDTLYIPGEVVVGFEDGLAPRLYRAQAQALAQSIGAQVVDQYQSMALLRLAPGADPQTVAAQIAAMDGVKYAEPNYVYWIPEDNPEGEQQTLEEVRLPFAGENGIEWKTFSLNDLLQERIQGSTSTYPNDSTSWNWWDVGADIIWRDRHASPTVCVVDTGVDGRHPDLRRRVINGYDFANDDRIANDDNGHGTHVAGVIAARPNNGEGLSGISNGRVLAVKVLTAQGWGTAYDIAAGIRFCADHRTKVINMSLGGPVGSQAEYDALDYAVNVKGAFVVVAAGNEGTSAYSYPAAWASAAVNQPDGDPNTISQATIAVGATVQDYSWWTDNLDTDGDGVADTSAYVRGTWVDTNGDGVISYDELFDHCATDFSNYGDWVEIVAPGEDIFSTLPTSYPFYTGYFYGDGVWLGKGNYDWWSGTSMAAPHVAAAAARIWSLDRYQTNAQIKAALLATDGTYWGLNIAEDPNWATNGTYTGDAPYCWPTTMPAYARRLNVAASMNRGAIWAHVWDATTGLPLDKARVYAYEGRSRRAVAQVTWSYGSGSALVSLLDLVAGVPHTLKVARSGYTYGAASYVSDAVTSPGVYNLEPTYDVAVPPRRDMTIVTQFDGWYDDMDLFLWLPSGSPDGIIGPQNVAGLASYMGIGSLRDYPWARYYREGGATDAVGVESITVKLYRGQPYYSYRDPKGTYEVFLQPWTGGDAIVRVWKGGRLVYNSGEMQNNCVPWSVDTTTGTVTPGDWWHVLSFDTGGIVGFNSCSDPVPYASADALQGIPGSDGIKK